MENSTSNEQGRYAQRGVSATKSDVHSAVDKLDQGLFSGAFCKITKDFLTNDDDKCNVIHSDGSGTKSILAYINFKETGSSDAFKGIAQDSIVMNTDDLLCIGAYGNVLISSTLNRNAKNCPKEVIATLINSTEDFLENMRNLGFSINSGGGETADVGDLTSSIVVDTCATAIMDKKDVITGDNILPNLVIVGLSSTGKSSYETAENSGIGSNGLTSARHDLLSPYYRQKYPETWDSNINPDLAYCGPYMMSDKLPESNLTVGEALLSPTRTYAPIICALLKENKDAVKGIVHCSGGGQTKCLRFGKGVHFVKDSLMPVAPIFKAIKKASGTTWKEMYQVYNMGHRMEIFCEEKDASWVIEKAKSFNVDAQIIGRTLPSKMQGKNHLTVKTAFCEENYNY